MADFAAAGRTHAAGLADRIGREIVVQHEGLLVGPLQRVDELLVIAGAERRDGQSLRLAAGEQSAAMRARQNADFRLDLADRLQIAAVDADALVEDVAADDRAFELLEHLARRAAASAASSPSTGANASPDPVLHSADGGVTFRLVRNRIGGAKVGLAETLDLGVKP